MCMAECNNCICRKQQPRPIAEISVRRGVLTVLFDDMIVVDRFEIFEKLPGKSVPVR